MFRTLVDQSNDAIKVVDPETLRFLDVNEKACSALGYSREELSVSGGFRHQSRGHGSLRRRPIRSNAENGIAGDGKRPPAKGRIDLPGGSQHEAGRSWGGNISLPSPATLPSANRPKRNLRPARAAIALFMKRSPVGVCWIDSQTGRFFGVNPKYCEIVGRTEQDLLGRTFQSITHPEDLAENLERLRQLKEGEVQTVRTGKKIRASGWLGALGRARGGANVARGSRSGLAHGDRPGHHRTQAGGAARLREYERVVEVLGGQ